MATDKVTRLLEALELEDLEEEEQNEVLAKLGELLFRDSMMRFFASLSEEKRAQFADLIESGGTPDDIAEYVTTNVPEADRLVSEAVSDLADDILAVTK